MNGGTVDSYDSFGNATKANTFSIENDITTYSYADVGSGGFADSAPGRIGIYTAPSGHRTNQTFTISDRNSGTTQGQEREGSGLGISGFIHTQIHEAGNALSNITGILRTPDKWFNPSTRKKEPYSDNDPGQAFENCVLRGYKSRLANQRRRR